MGTPPRCGLTNKVKLLPSRRTTYAGGKKVCYKCMYIEAITRRLDGNNNYFQGEDSFLLELFSKSSSHEITSYIFHTNCKVHFLSGC